MKIMVKTAAILVCFLALSCTTFTQKSTEILEGRALNGNATVVYTKDRSELMITGRQLPGLKIFISVPDNAGKFNFTRAELLSTHVQGWNESTLELSGEGIFRQNDAWGIFDLETAAERIALSGGRIRYKNNRMAGENALASLRNRRERIMALTDWMTGFDGEKVFESQKEFEKYWKKLLFPELVPKNNRPPEFSREEAEWVKNDGVKWNQKYTRIIFPEELWELRDSGALLRDWEETVSWIYIEYIWDSIIGSLNQTPFYKIK